MATSATRTGARLIRSTGRTVGRLEEGDAGLELVVGRGRRFPIVASGDLQERLRPSLGEIVSINGIKLFDLDRLDTVEVIAQSINPRPPFNPEKFRERMDRLAELLGPVFADVDPLKFGREGEE